MYSEAPIFSSPGWTWSSTLKVSPSMSRRYWEDVRGKRWKASRMYFSLMVRARYRPRQDSSKSSMVTCRQNSTRASSTKCYFATEMKLAKSTTE